MEKPWTNLATQEEVQLVKARSQDLRAPLKDDMANDEIFVSKDSIHILKHHGSYMQQNRDLKKKADRDKSYQFMLRLKVPVGEIPAQLFRELDDLSNKYGQGDLRATTRQAFQLHGVLKKNLPAVIADIANAGSNTYGGCGDINRNIMAPAVYFPNNPAYVYCMKYSMAIADLFKPMTESFKELWLDGKNAAKDEYWQEEIKEFNLDEVRAFDNGRGIITGHPVEPLYGKTYLPKKFKIAFTVPGDNSVDLYINDIGCVVITDPKKGGEVEGFNLAVGGGLGRTHKKEATFARAADHLGYVPKDKFMETLKAILAAQRDHGNREVRSNARMKYLVHKLGIDKFRDLVHSYLPEPWIEPWRELPPWEYKDWMGWHEQGDGKLFLGIPIDSGRVRDFEDGPQVKSALRAIVDRYDTDLILSPTQSILIKDIEPRHKVAIEELMSEHGVKLVEDVDALDRLAMACPALPLCGLAMTEAERVMPEYTARIRAQLIRQGLGEENIMMRMTGCPNGCARPYMAELAFVGDGQNSYQLWVAGSPNLDGRTGIPLLDKVKDTQMEETLEPLFAYWKEARTEGEAFGDFTHRIGKEGLLAYMDGYTATGKDLAAAESDAESDSDASIAPVVTQAELRAEMKGAQVTPAAEPAKPERRKDGVYYRNPVPHTNGTTPAPPPKPAGDAKIREVRAFRMFKGNPQWQVSWAADGAESWETFDKLDSAPARESALELQAAAK